MLALIIDTSSAAVTAAVIDVSRPAGDRLGDPAEVELRAERITVDARAHGERLAPQIQECLRSAGAVSGDLGAIVAGVGPGPFTGLRVGLVTAAVMGDLLNIPTYGVVSLDALAGAVSDSVGAGVRLLAAGDARRREIYWARYLDGVRVDGPHVHRPGDLPGLGNDDALVGAGARLYADGLGERLLDADYPSPLALARSAAERIGRGAPSERLVPLYLRRPDAVAPADYKAVTPLEPRTQV